MDVITTKECKENNELTGIVINCSNQIKLELSKIHIDNIGRNKTEDEELYMVLLFLQDNLCDIHLVYPISIFMRDKPDILLRDNHGEVGVEVTFAISESYQKAKRIRDKMDTSLILEPSLYKNNKTRKYIEDTVKKSNEKLYGSAYIDNELEEETAELILISINKKNSKFAAYDKFKENFLLISSETLFVDEEIVVGYIQKELELMSDIFFDKIILRLNGNNIFLI